MPYAVVCEQNLDVPADRAWDVWSDLASYPSWDPREEVNRPNGPLAVGMTGEFKQRGGGSGAYRITAVDTGRSWTSESPLPAGRLVIEHEIHPAGAGCRLVKRYVAHGPMAIAFRLIFARQIQADVPNTFAALAVEVARRSAARS